MSKRRLNLPSPTRLCPCCEGTGKVRDDKVVGALLRSRRRAAGIQASVVASKLGISQPLISALEHGHRRWTDERISEYERAIG